MSDKSPIYGQNPSGNQQPIQTDATGNLLFNAAGGATPQNVNIAQFNGQTTVMTANDGVAGSTIPENGIGLFNGGSNLDRWRGINGIGDNQLFGIGTIEPCLYNGTGVDRQRNNLDNITLVASAAYTTTQTTADQTNYNGRGIQVVLDMTVVGTGSVTLEIDMKDPVSGKYVALLTGAAVTTNSTNLYTVYPGAPATANVSANAPLPRTWRVKVTANNANSATYSVGACIIV